MVKTFFFGVVLVVFIGCKQGNESATQDVTTFDISTEKWMKKSNINGKATEQLKDWAEFNTMEKTFDGLYTVANTEDLSLIIEDLIEQQKLLEDSVFPEAFDKPQIKSRLRVFQTFVLKTKGHLEYRIDPEEPVLEMINAYNSLRNQFNVIANNTVDIKTLLQEN